MPPALLRRPGRLRVGLALALAVLAVAGAGAWYFTQERAPPSGGSTPVRPVADLAKQVHAFCGDCHRYPPADTFPRAAWKEEVERGYHFFGKSNRRLSPPPIDHVIRYYEERAPEKLAPAVIARASAPLAVRFAPLSLAGPAGTAPPAISHVSLVHLSDPKRLDILACEMRWGQIMSLRACDKSPSWRVHGKVANPAHAEVVDLDGDGIRDIIVADLGTFPPADRLCGSVVWLRGNPDGSHTPHTLFNSVGRVADVQAADFTGDGKLDLIVAVFGWQETGEIVLLENQTTDWRHPTFTPHVVDSRHGSIHVPVCDLNRDGKPDFVALLAQEHEEICAFVNDGQGQFHRETLYHAPHPAYGSSGIQLVDLDGDGQLDVLYTNGDVLDAPHLLKPYHQVQWLRNRGTGNLDFEHRPIAPLYGVHRAVAGDLDGDGDLDIVAVSYLPAEHFPQRDELNLDALVVFEQTRPGQFARHTLASKTCDHVTCAVGDVFGTGRADVVTGRFTLDEQAASLLILKNLGAETRDGRGP